MTDKRKEQLKAIVLFAKTVWGMLPVSVQESWYAGTGTYGFLEECVAMHLQTLNDLEWDVIIEIFDAEF